MKPQLQPYHRSARSDPDPVKTTQNTSNPEFSGFTSWVIVLPVLQLSKRTTKTQIYFQ
ncbi:hypothetical protein YC2023_106784 [Brassica napus]